MGSASGTFAGWLLFAALVLAVGSVAGRWLLAPRAGLAARGRPLAGSDPAPLHLQQELRESATRLGLMAAILLPVAMALVFARQLAEFRDPFATLGEDARLLLSTSWGRTWLAAAVVSCGTLAAMALARAGSVAAWWLATPLVVLLSAFPGLTGHAAGTGSLTPLTVAADTLHVLAAGAWVGGLAFVLYAEARWRRDPAPGSVLPVLVPVFSQVAMVSVAVLILTGLLASRVHLGGLEGLTTTTYGRILSAKLVLVAVVMAVGAINWRVLSPRLETPDGPRALRRAALLELLIAQAVLVVTAVLVRTSPLGS